MPPHLFEMWAYGVLALVLVAAAVVDVRTGKIHNWITYPAVAAALIGHYFGGTELLSNRRLGVDGALIGLTVGFLPLFLAWKAGGIGGGDAKLMAAVGALTGWKFALATLFYGFAVAGVMALLVMLRRRIVKRTVGRVWRFVVLTLMRAGPEDPAGADSPKIAFGLALCIGAALELADALAGGPIAGRLF